MINKISAVKRKIDTAISQLCDMSQIFVKHDSQFLVSGQSKGQHTVLAVILTIRIYGKGLIVHIKQPY